MLAYKSLPVSPYKALPASPYKALPASHTSGCVGRTQQQPHTKHCERSHTLRGAVSAEASLTQMTVSVTACRRGGYGAVRRESRLTCCSWNLAGVNENPFEFAAPQDERFPR